MTAQKDRISKQLDKMGAAWAVSRDKFISPDDEFGAAPTYHIHPDSSHPHVNDIICFDSLKELEEWIREVGEARRQYALKVAKEQTDFEYSVRLRGLTELAELTSIKRGTLDAAARAGRLNAEQSGSTWLATLADVDDYKARYVPRPRRKSARGA